MCMNPKSISPGIKANIFHDRKPVWNGTYVMLEAFVFLKLKCQVPQEYEICRIGLGLRN
jgi:hypothetical protein